MFNEDIRECRRQTTDQKTQAEFNIFFRQSHRKQIKAVTTAVKGGYTAAVQNNYGVPPPSPEEHHEAIDNLHTIFQGMYMQSYELELMEQSNAVLTMLNTAVMEKLAQMTMTMNAMQAQLKRLVSVPTNQTRSNRNYYCWICRSNYTHRIKSYSSKTICTSR